MVFRSPNPEYELSFLSKAFSFSSSGAWRSMAAEAANDACRTYRTIRLRYDPHLGTTALPSRWDRDGVFLETLSLSDLWEDLCITRSADLTLMMGFDPRAEFRLKPGSVARAVRRIWRRHSHRTPARYQFSGTGLGLLCLADAIMLQTAVVAIPERGADTDLTYGGLQFPAIHPPTHPSVVRGLGWASIIWR
jgi:hypothetical protein